MLLAYFSALSTCLSAESGERIAGGEGTAHSPDSLWPVHAEGGDEQDDG